MTCKYHPRTHITHSNSAGDMRLIGFTVK